MAFSALLFLTLFLPVFVALHSVTPERARNALLLVLSVVFYAWGAPTFVPVVLILAAVDYRLAIAIRAARTQQRTRAAKGLLAFAVVLHLGVLGYFKYSNFVFATIGVSWKDVALPIGVSFLTFEAISYLADAYRGDARPARSFSSYLLFLLLFPHAIAGPIFRWKDLEAQIHERRTRLEDVAAGVSRFTWGLGKKVLIADAAAITADAAFGLAPGQATASIAWVGAVAYAVQIYYDFSGYSDMAIGLGRMAGFRFKENFDDPYRSANITEFWTRWHISLSSWLRDYLYIPLGGNRHGEGRTRINVLVVFVLSGLWHGASWTFVLWGLYHGLLVLAERTSLGKAWRERAPRVFAVPVTFVLVVCGWVFFRARSVAQAQALLTAMFGFGPAHDVAPLMRGELLPTRSIVFIAIGLSLVVWRAARARPAERRAEPAFDWRGLAFTPVVLSLSLLQVVNTKFVPLIYFKF